MGELNKPITAFTVGPLSFYEGKRMLFGLTNAQAIFQRLMENCLGELQLNWCIIYVEDIIIFAAMPREHFIWLQTVFDKLRSAGIKLKPSECEFFQLEVVCLDHVISKHGVKMDPKKSDAVKNWTMPDTVTKVRKFLGFVNYYIYFIRGYAKISNPLYALIFGINANYKTNPI